MLSRGGEKHLAAVSVSISADHGVNSQYSGGKYGGMGTTACSHQAPIDLEKPAEPQSAMFCVCDRDHEKGNL